MLSVRSDEYSLTLNWRLLRNLFTVVRSRRVGRESSMLKLLWKNQGGRNSPVKVTEPLHVLPNNNPMNGIPLRTFAYRILTSPRSDRYVFDGEHDSLIYGLTLYTREATRNRRLMQQKSNIRYLTSNFVRCNCIILVVNNNAIFYTFASNY